MEEVDETIIVNEVQNLIGKYPLSFVDNAITHLCGEIEGKRVEVIIPPDFPKNAPSISVNGVPVPFRYSQGMSLVDCVEECLKFGDLVQQDRDPYEQFMKEVQEVIQRHPEFQAVNGDLHYLRGQISSPTGFVNVTVSIPPEYPVRDAVITFDRDIGYGISVESRKLSSNLAGALDAIKNRLMGSHGGYCYAMDRYRYGKPDYGSHGADYEYGYSYDDSYKHQLPPSQVPSQPAQHFMQQSPTQSSRKPVSEILQIVLGAVFLLISFITFASRAESYVFGTTGVVGAVSLVRGIYMLYSRSLSVSKQLKQIRQGEVQKAQQQFKGSYAGFGVRFGAYLIDVLILLIPLYFFTFSMPFPFDHIISAIVFVTYETAMLSAKSATLGKLALGLRVIGEDGSRVTVGKALGRSSVKWAIGGISWIGIVTDEKKRAWHDRVVGTVVVR